VAVTIVAVALVLSAEIAATLSATAARAPEPRHVMTIRAHASPPPYSYGRCTSGGTGTGCSREIAAAASRRVPVSGIDDEFLTVADVAAVLKLNQQTVRNWIDQGSLPALHVGRRVRIRRSDFEALLERSRIGAPRVAEPSPAEAFWEGELVQTPTVDPAEGE
jgi:excisionase family DNA binding protein